jgi:circadian clock protein KaiC
MKAKQQAKAGRVPSSDLLKKAPTGVRGLDEVTGGGLPKGRPTLIAGGAGSGKTTLAMEFLVRGAVDYGEPGVFVTFEERVEDLITNFASMGFRLESLVARGKLALDYVQIERSEIEETGEYDLEGLFIRLGHAIDSVRAKRVVLDTLEALFAGLPNETILRAELRRLFRWLKERGVTAIITGERGSHGTLTRHGLEEYVADCVISIDQRIEHQVATRRLRIVKYRGSSHGTNEYPFLISDEGVSVLPITSAGLTHTASHQRISTGIPRLDAMMQKKGYYRGSTVLVSGTAGTGKSSLAAAFVQAAARRGERCLYFAFEESPAQIMRNMRSINIDLEPWVEKRLLHFQAYRPTLHGLELHLLTIHEAVDRLKPKVVVLDPITNLIQVGSEMEVKSMLTRLLDYFKLAGITTLLTSLTRDNLAAEHSEVGISSLIDTWLLLRNVESGGERNRALYILKSRGMAHSNQIREYLLSDHGIDLADVYVGPDPVLTGSARATQESRERTEAELRRRDTERRRREIERERKAAAAEMAGLRAELDAKIDRLSQEIAVEEFRQGSLADERRQHARRRMDGSAAAGSAGRRRRQSQTS